MVTETKEMLDPAYNKSAASQVAYITGTMSLKVAGRVRY